MAPAHVFFLNRKFFGLLYRKIMIAVNPLLNPAITNGGHGINLIKKPPVLHTIPVKSKSPIARPRLTLDPLNMVLINAQRLQEKEP